ncbi:peptide-methionine (S)-S-oxide reductase MsrA [Aureibacillus halotolerans]|uniref:Peptide methionine sulfoxide reductase MsrA n=1 Tax=Aureibacillus halotolerans TaxID=1508390 RepID=A0A4R6TTU5_9BACI|nr:peptide-methionine (S)-S-oxide reductase MsrA [Aureibacillus halotolerans]TDQ35413.1 peptide-methionine (S)-S-oxide reductase [Aureibacillus halotolerans]
MERATFGAGCFWGVELAFSNIQGVQSTRVGYLGGALENPSYEDVCTDKTGHAEVVDMEYDPAVVTFETLLAHFWELHDPTTLNRQGEDEGTQYRSAIFYHTSQQRLKAEESKQKQDETGGYASPIVTEITEASTFYPAEEYHQNYLKKRGLNACSVEQ